MTATWRRLEGAGPMPGAPTAPPGFADAVLRRARAAGDTAWPAAVRWAAPAFMAAGIAGGVWLGRWAAEAAAELAFPPEPASLAETYVELLMDDAPNLEEEGR